MPVDTHKESTAKREGSAGVAVLEQPEIVASLCNRLHMHRSDGQICNGNCTSDFGHPGKCSCGKCGEDF